jgi:hypothetical protein
MLTVSPANLSFKQNKTKQNKALIMTRQKFQNIPCIYAGDLPQDVLLELQEYDEELCFHGDGGCVFRISAHVLENLPLFKAWMIEIGAWTEDDVNLADWGLFMEANPGKTYQEFLAETAPRKQYLKVAMTGT